jgi:hypothetical protein
MLGGWEGEQMLYTPLKPMLFQKASEVPVGSLFLHQLKFDGHRALVHFEAGKTRIFTRQQNECTAQYPELHSLKLKVQNCILDGEMIVLDDDAKPCSVAPTDKKQCRFRCLHLPLSCFYNYAIYYLLALIDLSCGFPHPISTNNKIFDLTALFPYAHSSTTNWTALVAIRLPR